MRRRTFFLGLSGLAGCTRDTRPRLNVYNWSAYVAPETIPAFEAEFGVRVRYATYESNEEMLAKVLTGNSGWDVVFPTHNRLQPMREYGLLAPLNHGWLPGLENLDSRFRAPAWDAGLAWGVPYMWNGTGIVYNRTVQPAPARWADLWDVRLKGRLTMLDDPEDMLGACLKKLGHSFSTTDATELRAAEREAIAQKPLLSAYLNAEVRDQLVSGRCAGSATVVDDGPAGDRRRAQPGLRLSGRGVSVLLRLRRDPAGKPAHAAGASIPRLSPATTGFSPDCGGDQDRNRESRRARPAFRKGPDQPGPLSACRHIRSR